MDRNGPVDSTDGTDYRYPRYTSNLEAGIRGLLRKRMYGFANRIITARVLHTEENSEHRNIKSESTPGLTHRLSGKSH
ncbi:hypothetical protein EVAR_17623_1 [Eumeta japonica]|uniref:Uncharacterized protein n=1 Tax=Eumeta variegata TaxID=151549 RepID=A0A4C1UBX0_EUMVA|nr:hypothetical protein EVAR_17623_1 [Eumeta japonica]